MRGPKTIAASACLWMALCAPGQAALRVDVTQGNLQPLPIAIPDFVGAAPGGSNVADVVRADLESSGLFRPLDQKSFLDKITNINVTPNYANWRVINAQALVTGQQSVQADGRLCGTYCSPMPALEWTSVAN